MTKRKHKYTGKSYNRVKADTTLTVKMSSRLKRDIEYGAEQIFDPGKQEHITPSEFVRRACISYLRRLSNGKSSQQQLF